jgi:hypothetical protein
MVYMAAWLSDHHIHVLGNILHFRPPIMVRGGFVCTNIRILVPPARSPKRRSPHIFHRQ